MIIDEVKILLVDDEPAICHLIEEMLKFEGYLVDVSFSGTDALDMINNCDYQMLITDIKMPGIDGLELIEKAKEKNPEIRTIIITGYTTVDTVVQSLRRGVDDYIKKPFNVCEMKKVVKNIFTACQVANANAQVIKNLKRSNRELVINENGLTEDLQIAGEQLTRANEEIVQRINELDTIKGLYHFR